MGNDDFEPEWIWGDDDETTVYAQAYGSGHTIIFSFKLDATKPPTGLANRLCTCYHGLSVHHETTTFPDRPAMRKALWEAVGFVWPHCLKDLEICRPDAVVDVDGSSISVENVTWRVFRHRFYRRYIKHLGDASRMYRPFSQSLRTLNA